MTRLVFGLPPDPETSVAPESGHPPLYLLVDEVFDLIIQIQECKSPARAKCIIARANEIAGLIFERVSPGTALVQRNGSTGMVLVPVSRQLGNNELVVLLARDVDEEWARKRDQDVLAIATRLCSGTELSRLDISDLRIAIELGVGASSAEARYVIEALGDHLPPRDSEQLQSLVKSLLVEIRERARQPIDRPLDRDEEPSMLDTLMEGCS